MRVKSPDLEVEVCWREPVLPGARLQHLQSVIAERLGYRSLVAEEAKIDLQRTGALSELAERQMAREWEMDREFSRMLEAEPSGQAQSATLELWSSDRKLDLVLSMHPAIFNVIAGELKCWNSLSISHSGSDVTWVEPLLHDLLVIVPALHAYCATRPEYDAYNIVGGRGGGVDYGRHLPGLYWMNFFGRPYVELIGRGRLLSAPCSAQPVADGVLVRIGDTPQAWQSGEYKAIRTAVLEHIGAQYFFDRERPNAETVAPEWPTDMIDAPNLL